eukprot:GHVS01088891.1.p1 GENE.GHVS01088891.1~~GHVS01088891.1.p1  ORF type:complete len:342 (-),score=65.52 GHVS01088891.1:582-1607(-)
MMVRNFDQRKMDYANTSLVPRPGHADYTYMQKYAVTAGSGGGRASARETIARVAAGSVVEKWLSEKYGVIISCWVSAVGEVSIPADIAKALERHAPCRGEVERLGELVELAESSGGGFRAVSDVAPPEGSLLCASVHTRCPHPPTALRMAEKIKEIRLQEDSIGGVLTCVIKGCPVGIGEPCFDKLEAQLAKAMMSLPATKGFEIGDGFAGCRELRGSENNDCFVPTDNNNNNKPSAGDALLRTATNHAGGTLGGITTGEDIVFRVAIKAASSISQPQVTATYDGESTVLTVNGRHDPCVLPRAPPIVEAMAALVVGDLALKQRARSDKPLTTLSSSSSTQ